MSRNRFVWEVQIRREVLDDEIARLHELPYTVLRRGRIRQEFLVTPDNEFRV